MLAPVTHLLPLTTVQRERLLPVPGQVFAHLDQKISPLDVVGEAHLGGQHLLLDVARQLRVPPEKADKLIKCRAGDQVVKNQAIAQSRDLIPQTIRAGQDGKVLLVGGGKVLLEVGETAIELIARVPGTVTRVVQDRGIEITFSGALVQGVWGNGQVDSGMILPLLNSPEDVLTAKQLDVSQRGAVILAGQCSDPAALETAGELPVRGLILGSLSPTLLGQAAQMHFPIIVVDGFDGRPLNTAAFKLLTSNAKREVTVNAEIADRYNGARPEIYIPLPVTEEPPRPREVETFAPDQPVRLLRTPHAGAIGILINLKPGLATMPSGLRLQAAEVKLETGEQVVVPLANLEVLG
ncbi:MAG: hypothetical protein ABSB41_08165 [Anaerolineales bacterium]|jgi:hypothetical protein